MHSPGAPRFGSRPSFLYQLGLGLVTVAMVILPCLYVALTLAAGYGVYYFATHYFGPIWAWHIGHSRVSVALKLICSMTPLLAGSAIAFFMVKPLFARRAARMQPLALNPEIEPRVHALVQAICERVGAPAPRRIELNCEINASATFEGHWRGLFTNRLILTLGLPLVAGLTERELAGVIAHEFGHFRQGAGLRLTYLIRTINGWFGRVVYERDGWDEAIASWSQTDSHVVSFMVGGANFSVWVSRRILWILMMGGHAICALLLREMEYDADRVEIALAGSAAFETTTLKLATLGLVHADIQREMLRSWRSNLQLPDNLPVLLEYRHSQLSTARRQKAEGAVGLSKTGLLDTHPSAGDRVRQARLQAEPGELLNDGPARDLFAHFAALSRMVTLAHYEDDLNVPVPADFLIPLERLLAEKTEAAAAGPTPPAAPAPLPVPKMSYDPSAFQKPQPPVS